ncbi:ATP-binding protein [Desulfonema magnum]|uniref:Serine-protein kinase n=1 Tax=Desulfonema magnum TaxID=45655 RepID=A0A975GRM7_9BACT|nr:ATP-binding protein [Desulfonema magnum]QTA91077.1 Serine-protein kinase [Desulfonema magnum]
MQRLSFDFPADTRILAKIGNLAADAGRNAGFNDVGIGDIQLAIDEACTNTIIHGLKKDPSRTFQLIIQWKTDEIEILIHEKGEPFDPSATRIPDPEASLEDRPVGGLGIYFVRELMDKVEYRTDEEGIKTLRMVKRVSKS